MPDFLLSDMEQEMICTQTSETTSVALSMPVSGIYLIKINKTADDAVSRSLLITKDSNICQGRPIILGTRISVSNIVELYYLLKWDIQKIKDAYPHLSNEQIIAALEYYEDHTKEIDTYLQEEKEVDVTDKTT